MGQSKTLAGRCRGMRIGRVRLLWTLAFGLVLIWCPARADETVVVTSVEDVRELIRDDVRSSVKVSPRAPDLRIDFAG